MARFNIQDKSWLPSIIKQGKFNETEKAILLTVFDEQTQYDIRDTEERMKKEKQARRVALYKIIMFPFEYIAISLIFGKKGLQEKLTIHKIYTLYYKKKINYIEFQKRLANLYKDGTITVRDN